MYNNTILIYKCFVFTCKSDQWAEQYNSVLTIVRIVTTRKVYYSKFHVVKQSSGVF